MKSAVMIGDSHSQIIFPLLKDKLNLNYKEIISKPGWGIRKYMNENIIESLPEADVVIVSLGGNNFEMTPTAYGEEVQRFLDLLKTKFKRVVWIGPFYSDDQSVNFRHARTNVLLKLDLPISVGYIETYKLSKPLTRRDQVHFTRDGYKEIVSLIEKKAQALTGGSFPRVWISHPKFLIPMGLAVTFFTLGIFSGDKDG